MGMPNESAEWECRNGNAEWEWEAEWGLPERNNQSCARYVANSSIIDPFAIRHWHSPLAFAIRIRHSPLAFAIRIRHLHSTSDIPIRHSLDLIRHSAI